MRRQIVFRLVPLILASLMLFPALTSCGKIGPLTFAERSDGASAQSNPEAAAKRQSADPWYCNLFRSAYEPPFALLQGEPEISDGYRFYENVPSSDYEAFLSELCAAGFALRKMKYRDFLFRDDCMIYLSYDADAEKLIISWYSKSPFAPDGGVTTEEAAARLTPDGENSLSPIALHPIDITPEGFYERTGGQFFAVPHYSFDRYKTADPGIMTADNEYYTHDVICILGDRQAHVTMECAALEDINGDGAAELLLLSYGPTSGLFTFVLTAVTRGGIFRTIFNTPFYVLSFAEKDGKIVVAGADNGAAKHFFDVGLIEGDGYGTVMLYEDGAPLQTWGVRSGNGG